MGGSGGLLGELTGFNVAKQEGQKERVRVKREQDEALRDIEEQEELTEERTKAVKTRQRKRRTQRAGATTGRKSTILTGPSGVTGGDTTGGKTLLGL